MGLVSAFAPRGFLHGASCRRHACSRRLIIWAWRVFPKHLCERSKYTQVRRAKSCRGVVKRRNHLYHPPPTPPAPTPQGKKRNENAWEISFTAVASRWRAFTVAYHCPPYPPGNEQHTPDGASLLPIRVRDLVGWRRNREPAGFPHLRRQLDGQAAAGGGHGEGGVPGPALAFFELHLHICTVGKSVFGSAVVVIHPQKGMPAHAFYSSIFDICIPALVCGLRQKKTPECCLRKSTNLPDEEPRLKMR